MVLQQHNHLIGEGRHVIYIENYHCHHHHHHHYHHHYHHKKGRTTYLVGGGSGALGGEEHELNGGDLRLNLLKLGLQAVEMHISDSILAMFEL